MEATTARNRIRNTKKYIMEKAINILDIKMQENSAGADTIKDYLKQFLLTAFREGEGFSGKRPFGESGWIHEIEYALVAGKAINGEIDEYDYLISADSKKADLLIKEAIESL